MKQLIVEAPLSQLSFGQCTYNLLRELSKTDIEVGYFPIGNTDLSCFEPKKEFVDWLQAAINRRYELLKRDVPSVRLWHLSGSDNLRTPNQTLLTFYECSEPTQYEKTIASLQKKTLFSSVYAAEKFRDCGNASNFACGFDQDLHITGKKYLEGKVSWTLCGKWENRKATKNIIQAWVKKYGNNSKHSLNLLVTNPFFSPEDNQRVLADALGNQRFWNVNNLPPLKTNKEVCELLNATDIDLSGLSFGEGWGLPSFNATALGKWSIVNNHTSHKDWATAENSILVEPDGEMPVYDGVFFKEDSPVNHGVFYTLSEEKMIASMERAEQKIGQPNTAGLMLQKTHSWKNSLDHILEQVYN